MLGAELVALVRVLVYVGAVVVLVLFALMLTRAPIGPRREHAAGPWRSASPARSSAAGDDRAPGGGAVRPSAAGRCRSATAARRGRRPAVRTWVWPFELLSLLLLVALVAAFAVSRMPRAADEPRARRA